MYQLTRTQKEDLRGCCEYSWHAYTVRFYFSGSYDVYTLYITRTVAISTSTLFELSNDIPIT